MKALLAFLLLTGPAYANTCAPRPDVVAKLENDYGEALRFGGMQTARGQQLVMEFWASAETGTYTVLLTYPSGLSCIVAVGTDFFEAIPRQVVEGNPL